MRRYAPLILFFLVLVAPLALSRWLQRRHAPADPAALELIIITPHQEGIRREFADAFSDWHARNFGRTVRIDYRNYGGGSDLVRYFDESRDTTYKSLGTFSVDLAWGGGDYLFDTQLKKAGYLEAVRLDESLLHEVYPRPDIAGVTLYDPEGYWFGTALSSFGIVYNADVLRQLGIEPPTTWRDLADPRLAGWVVLADATRSASARQAYMTIVEKAMADASADGHSEDEGWAQGMGLVRLIASNARFFTDSASAVPIVVGGGDAAAGMAIDFYARSQADAISGGRLGYVEPADATIINPDPIALVKGARNRETAERFIRFVLSREGQALWNTRPGLPGGPRQTALRRLPVHPALYERPEVMTDPVNPYRSTVSFNKSNAREKTFAFLGEWIAMSCVDVLDELRQTRAAIAASPQRAELEARLGRFPFDQAEALRRAAQWKNVPPAERLRLSRRWTADFAREYEQLCREAEAP